MDYKELAELLNRRGLSNGSSLGVHSGLCDSAADAITELLERAEAAEKKLQYLEHGGWISVEDDLPKEKGVFLVRVPGYFGKCHIYGDVAHSSFQPNYKTPWAIERGGRGSWVPWKVTHWMSIRWSEQE